MFYLFSSYNITFNISLNSISKFKARCLPSLLDNIKNGNFPKRLLFGLSCLIEFYNGQYDDKGHFSGKRNGNTYEIRDNFGGDMLNESSQLKSMAAREDGSDDKGSSRRNFDPTAVFVPAVVTDSNGNPIKGIVVSSTGVTDSATGKGLEAVTAEDGSFATNQVHEFGIFGKLLFADVDGAENGGEFATKTVDLNALPKSQVTEGDSWYSGEYEVTADVELRKK